jgi:hypothetical protein
MIGSTVPAVDHPYRVAERARYKLDNPNIYGLALNFGNKRQKGKKGMMVTMGARRLQSITEFLQKEMGECRTGAEREVIKELQGDMGKAMKFFL